MGIKRGRTFFCQIARYLEAIWKLFQHVDKDDIGPRLRTAPKKHPETEDSAPETTKHQRNINETSTMLQWCPISSFRRPGLGVSREMGYDGISSWLMLACARPAEDLGFLSE